MVCERRMLMASSNSHDASGQLSGYLYQVLSALLLLLDNEDPEAQLCIEKFDDVTFLEDDEPRTMVQVKHQLYRQGSLTDTSVDFWRTIKVWCDYLQQHGAADAQVAFVIITTARANDNSVASFLKKGSSRDWKKAFSIIREISKTDDSKSNQNFYLAFQDLTPSSQEYLAEHIYVYDSAPQIGVIKDKIMPYVRMVTLQPFEDRVYEKVLGWWINNTIKCLSSVEPVFISYRQLQKEMYDVGSEYKVDSLPIDIDPLYNPTPAEIAQLSPQNKVFIGQLNLISLSHDRLKRCIRDYYNAYAQRSLWVREQLLFINDLQKYEKRLIDEWNRLFLVMKEDLEDYGDNITESQKIKAGRALLGQVEELNLPIRKNVPDPFIMRGTYHGLSNELSVGWHIDFMDRLCSMLKG